MPRSKLNGASDRRLFHRDVFVPVFSSSVGVCLRLSNMLPSTTSGLKKALSFHRALHAAQAQIE